MALGTPVAAATAYSASGGTTVSPAYPSGILATDAVLLFVGQKPSTANGGTVTTPTGWTLRDELTAAGGYGATLGADTGNTNLRVYSWDTPVADQTGNLAVTLGVNNVSWAFMVRIPTAGGALRYGSADGQRTTAPTSPMSIALTDGSPATAFETGDLAIWAMCIPTDVTTPNQFSAQSISATGATFDTEVVELNEPDSTVGNDIGGYSAYTVVLSGSSTTAPTVTTNVGGTLTNVRGPVVLVRVREARIIAPNLYTNGQTFYSPVVLRTETTVTAGSDITTVGWTPSSGVVLYAMIDEAVPSDADWINSPNVTGAPSPVVFGLTGLLAAGATDVKIRARRVASIGQIRVVLQDVSGTTVGTSSWQTLTDTFTTYTLSVTTTGTAAQARFEVQS